MKVHLTSLGCAKNQVDSELLLGAFAAEGLTVCDDPAGADVLVVNTCAFIEEAVNEAVDTILDLARYKSEGSCRRLIVCGCLPERFGEDLAGALPEADFFFGTGAYHRVIEAVAGKESALSRCTLPPPDAVPMQTAADRRICARPHTVYVKIAEGCDRRCTYCIIPRLRGRQRSRPPADITAEARGLVAAGAKEIVLVAQETTAYGADLSPSVPLSVLLAGLSDAVGDTWVRVLYMHPDTMDPDLIGVMAQRDNICSYFDVPVQHASDRILKRMGRRHTAADLHRLFDDIRRAAPDAVLRTTVMVGFPGEKPADFEKLLDFITGVAFDHLGAFIYSDDEALASHGLDGHVSAKTARRRYDRVMTAQIDISARRLAKRVGSREPVLVEEKTEDGLFLGRAWFQAPEVDGDICFSGAGDYAAGDRVFVHITGASAYDLTGEAQ
ncbi:MAG: 30S ribosomal protein S12 methylthiotransferase RimO [Thermodesulfobacteriota bacterium]|nr:30S ribosomal protein S12 methylthiotransferase RimO [Thermodesulfobacteriota bacterium]